MAVEQGIVTEVTPGIAWVKTERNASCEGCASKGSCMSKGGDMIVRTINAADARVGDRVVISLKTGAFLRATFLIYLVPVIFLMIGAITGHVIAGRLDMDPSPVAAVTGLGCLVLAVMLVKRNAGRMSADAAYQPKIVRVIGHAPPVPGTMTSSRARNDTAPTTACR